MYKLCMTLEEKAASLARDEKSRDEIVALLASQEHSAARIAELERQLRWFREQTFGQKSERRVDVPDATQLALGQSFATGAAPPVPAVTVPAHTRSRAKKPWEGTPGDSGLRFDPEKVPVIEIKVPNPDTETYPPGSYDVVGQRVTYRLAQLPASYVVMKYTRDVLKLKDTESFSCPPAPPAVIDKSYADVSFLAVMIIDKLLYHLPLYRQHQRLLDSGIMLARMTFTNLIHQSALLLRPIYEAQLRSILAGPVIAIDETTIRAGRSPNTKGKMHSAYFWPIYGHLDEVAFHFAKTRSHTVLDEVLKNYAGTAITDGYGAYERFGKKLDRIQRAQCWSHARREFLKAEEMELALVQEALSRIRAIYAEEARIRDAALTGDAKMEHRAIHTKPLVDSFFKWLEDTVQERLLLPSNLFTKAAAYTLDRKAAMSVFLENPDVPIDTNHLEREIRPIAVGRKNWLFCWTEAGAEDIGILQSLLRTCRLQGVDPYTYLIDVLQRIATHPAAHVDQLTPRLWNLHFAQDPMKSDLSRVLPAKPIPDAAI